MQSRGIPTTKNVFASIKKLAFKIAELYIRMIHNSVMENHQIGLYGEWHFGK
jgi:hypothetical protein